MPDVIVVGAGPAGIAAARTLAAGGSNVTMFDKHTQPGNKACAGGLVSGSWASAGIDPSCLPDHCRAFNELELRTPLGRISLKQNAPIIVTFDRLRWTREQLTELSGLGVNLRLGEQVVGLQENMAHTQSGRFQFDALVGADGAASRIRRGLGLSRGLLGFAWQLTAEKTALGHQKLPTDRPIVWFDPKQFGSGYAWSFPTPSRLRLGCGGSIQTISRTRLKESFHRWLDQLDIDPSVGQVQAASIPSGYLGHRFGNVYLAGDAAGLASPLTGEGIGQAFISGTDVAREILNPSYRSKKIAALSVKHRRTHDALLQRYFLYPGYGLATLLLRIPAILKETQRRYLV